MHGGRLRSAVRLFLPVLQCHLSVVTAHPWSPVHQSCVQDCRHEARLHVLRHLAQSISGMLPAISPSEHSHSRAQATVAVPRTIGWIGMVQTCCIRILPDTGVVWVLPKVYGQRPVGPPAGAIPRPCHRRRSRDDVRSPAPYPASAATHLAGRDSEGPEPRSIQSPQ